MTRRSEAVNFRESESYLLSLGNEVAAMKLGLENITTLLRALGNPQDSYKKVQVAGTNGKGSVCAFLDSICLDAGIRTGRFTSPHLVSITERVTLGGIDISEDEFAKHATRVREISEKLVADGGLEYVPTYFEQVTAIALAAFAEAGIELAILETGLGGRFDATTAAKAEIAAITKIDYDHQQYLGDTIEEIASEKAAIIRADSEAVVLGEQNPEAEKVILDRCRQLGVVPKLASQVVFDGYGEVRLGLKGKHQIQNATIAILLAEALSTHFPIEPEHMRRGLETARHPGRLEYISNVLLDGAHNIAGAEALAAFLDEFEPRPLTMIFGTMGDKDVSKITAILFPKAANLILTTPENTRAVPAHELLKFTEKAENVRVTKNAAEAIRVAEQLARDGVILVTGSLYLVGEIRDLINKTVDSV